MKKISHQWDNTVLKLENPDGTFDEGVNLKGEKGDDGTLLQQEAIDALQSDVTILIDEAMTSVKETTLESEVLGFDNTGTGFLNKLTFPFGKTTQIIVPLINIFNKRNNAIANGTLTLLMKKMICTVYR